MSKTFSHLDRRCMKRALVLAMQGHGLTLPNPRVGAVLVKGGKIIGEGYHQKAGGPHAEVLAIRAAEKAGHAVEGATLYVTLEPCSTHGRTPPCTELIIRKKISRVCLATFDPNPAHAGRGITFLRQAGIKVSSGLQAEEAREMNRDFNHWIVSKRPWVVAKIALSLDGKIMTPESDDPWLTSLQARQQAHELRWAADAILIGGETARRDNPHLTIRLPGRKSRVQPWRIVLTRSGNLPSNLNLFTDRYRQRTRIFQKQSLRQVLKELGQNEISHVLIEGGGKIIGEAFRRGLVDEVAFFIAPIVVGTEVRSLPNLLKAPPELTHIKQQRLGPDFFYSALIKKSSPVAR